MTEKRYMRRYGNFSDGTLLDNVLNKQLSHLEVRSLVNEQSEDIIRLGNKIDYLLEENEQLKKENGYLKFVNEKKDREIIQLEQRLKMLRGDLE